MTDWALRKDIDRVKQFANDIDNALAKNNINSIRELLETIYDQSDVDIFTAKLNKDLNNLDTNLVTLKANLIEFNGALIDFSEDNENLDYDLTKLKENLLEFVDVLGVLDVDLRDLESSLNDLNGQVNGDSTHTGFLTYVQELQTNIYGGSGYSINNPSPSSLKGTLNSFSEQLSDLSAGDTKLALTLSALTGYLTTFKGTLSEFQDKIIEDYGQSYYDGLDEEIVKLIGAITSANQDIEDHQDLIDSVQDTIGQSSDTGNSTLFGKLYNTNATATSASNSANAVTNTVNNTITPQLNTVRNIDIPNVKNKMGYNNIPTNQTLQGQITTQQNELSTQTGRIDTLEDETIPDLSDKIGDVDVANDGSLADQVLTNGGDVSDVKNKMGYNNIPTNQTLQGQINTTDGKIGTVPTGQTLQGQITTHTNQIGTVPSGKTLQGQISSTDAKIGSKSNDDETDNTVFGWINKSLADVSNVQDDIGDMSDLTGTLVGNINDSLTAVGEVEGDVSDLQDAVGTVDVTNKGDLQTQILNSNEFLNLLNQSIATLLKPNSEYTKIYYCSGVPDTQELLILESDYGYDTSNIQYAISENGTQYVRQGAGWVAQEIPSSAYLHSIGIRASFSERRQDGFNPNFTYVYSVSTNEYFELRRS